MVKSYLVVSLALLAIVPFLVLDVTAQTLTISTPTGFPNTASNIQANHLVIDHTTTTATLQGGNTRYAADVDGIGEIYVPTTKILSNPVFSASTDDDQKRCTFALKSVKNLVSAGTISGFAAPSNIQPNQLANITALGFRLAEEFTGGSGVRCPVSLHTTSQHPLITEKELRIMIYDKDGKTPYFFSPRDGVTAAKLVPACTTSTIHTSNQTLKGDTIMCYGKNDDDLVIVTKRLAFYGAADSISDPIIDPTSRDNVTGIGSLTASLFDITTIGAGKGSIDTDGKYTYAGGATISKSPTPSGHIYIPSNAIISSSAFVAADAGKTCAKGQVLPSDYSASVALPAGVSNITAYGFGSSNAGSCVMSPVELGKQQRDVDKVLQVVLYDQAGKHGYFYDRSRNITTAQYIAPCDDGNNFDNATKMLRNNVKMCYADVGTDLVIYTTVMQFYGANETPIDPPSISRDNVIGIGSLTASLFDITTIGAGKGSIDTDGKYTYAGGATISKSPTPSGHIYIPPHTIISSSAFVAADAGKTCAKGQVLPSDYSASVALPAGVSNITAYGFGSSNAESCVMSPVDLGKRQRDVNNVLHVVLYDQAGKHGYSYSRSQNINTAQYIAACDTTNFDNPTKALRNNVKMCYADVGTDLVIYTTVMQFYGATETPLDPPTPDPTDPLPPPGTIKIPPPDGFPTAFRSDFIIFTTNLTSNTAQMTDPKADVRDKSNAYDFGDIFIQNGTRIVSNPTLTNTCNVFLDSIYRLNLYNVYSYTPPTNVQPNLWNGERDDIDEIVAIGFHENSNCKNILHNPAAPPLITDKELRVTIYDEYDKKPYFYSKRANMTEAQQIPACAADNFDEITLKLKGDTKMCAGVNGTNMVIITKRFTGFYGAADTITAPATPIDLDAGGPPDPAPSTPTPTPSALLALAPPASYSNPTLAVIDIISSAGNTTGYTSHQNNDTTFTHTTDLSTAIGDLFLVHPVPILSNPFFSGVTDEFKPCAAFVESLAALPSRLVPNFAVPDNITPNTKSSLVGLGLDFRNGTGGEPACSPDPESVASDPLITGKELRFTLYNQSDQSPYYFSPRDNITKAQQIPACSSTNLDISDQTLKGDNSMCYGEHGDHMVIITKRLAGFYGAADTVTPPTNPVDLTIGAAPPDPSTPVTPDPTDPPLPAGTIKIPPPSDFPSGEPTGTIMRLVPFSQNREQQTSQYDPTSFATGGIAKRQATSEPRVGEVFVPGRITILANPHHTFLDMSAWCHDLPIKNLTNSISTISNIQPTTPIGLGYEFDDPSTSTPDCKAIYDGISDYPVFTDKELRVTLYDKYDKKPYYISPRDNVTQAQPITACSSTNFDTNNQTLKDDTKMCYGVNGTNMVIITKRFGGFYGAADTVTTPTNPIDLDSAGPSLAATTSRQDVSKITSTAAFDITSGHLGVDLGYPNIAVIDTYGKYTFATTGNAQGHIYISPSTITVVDFFTGPFKEADTRKDCVRSYIASTAHADYNLPEDVSEGVAYGFVYTNGTDTCNYNSNSMAQQFQVNTPFRIVLYDQAGKQAYSYLPAANINTSQNITKCSSTNLDNSTKIPLGSTLQCYEDVGDDLVIYSEVMQWYGAKTPSSGAPDPTDPPLPAGTIKIPPPDGFPTTFRSDHIVFTTNTTSNTAQMTTPKADVRGKTEGYDFGDIFVQNGTRIVSNPAFDTSGQCNFVVDSIYGFVWSNRLNTYPLPTNVQPNLANGTRAAIDEIVTVGFNEKSACRNLLHNPAAPPLITDKELRVTIYDEYDKKPYFYSKRANMTEAQQIPACSSTNYDSTTQTLKGDTKMCAGVNGTNMVIITKRFTGFYGAADTITTPATPIDLDAGGAPDPAPTTPSTPTPSALLSLAPPASYGSPAYVSIKILSNTSNTTGYTVHDSTVFTTTYTHTPLPDNQKGDIFFSHPVPILSNPIFSGFNDETTQCITNVRSLAEVSSSLIPGFALPNGISNDTVMLGLDFYNSTDETFATPCSPDIETTSSDPLITGKELRYTLYNQSDKSPYYFSPRDSILVAQPIPACSSTNLDATDQTLKGGNTMCYGEHGDHMVIITKRLAGFYGATDTVPTPVSPVNLTVDIAPPVSPVVPPVTPPVTPDPTDLLTISGTIPSPVFTSTTVISDAGVKTGYITTSSSNGHTFTHTNILADRIGSIFVPDEPRIPSNDIFTTARSECDLFPIDIKTALNNNYVTGLAIPDNIKPKTKNSLVALGFDMRNASGASVSCSPDLESNNNPGPLLLDKALYITLSGKSKKDPYYISPRDNVTSAQQIAACSSTNYDTAAQTLKGTTEMCYGKNGTDMVILTKRLAGFYGAANNVTVVSSPDPSTPDPSTPDPSTPDPSTPDPTPGTTDPTSRDNVKGIGTNPLSDGLFNITTSAAGNGSIDASGKYSYIASGVTQKGHIYIPPDTIIYDDLFVAADVGKTCVQGHVIPSDYNPSFSRPSDVSDGTAYGFAGINGPDSDTCTLKLSHLAGQLNTSKTFQVVLYDQAGKEGYYYHRSIGINTAQDIAKCSSTNFDDTSKTLKGTTQHCYKNVGGDLVIYAKVIQMYGAKTAGDTGANINTVSRDDVYGIGVNTNFNITTSAAGNGSIDTSGKYTWSAVGTQPKGHIYIPPDTIIYDDLFAAADIGKTCMQGRVIPSDYSPIISRPSDISDGTAYGFLYLVGADSDTCTLKNTAFVGQFNTSNTLEVVLYDQAGKEGYYYHPGININTSQDMTECSSTIFDDTTKTFKGTTKHCYADVGDDLVIYTKVLLWYGAKTLPSDDDSDMANAPTFGTSPLTGEQLVTCGYKMDDTCRDITAYHVQYERDTIQTNTTHTFALKALAPNMIDSFTLAFGVPEIGSPISAAEAYITAKLAVNYTSPSYYNIVQVTVHDPNNIIDYDIADTEIARVSCSGGTLECAQVTFPDVLFRETLYHEPFVVMITDTLLYTSINYMNEGILVTGTPLNEQPTVQPGITVDTGDIRPTKLVLVRTDKVNDLWADAFGNTWSRNSFGNYIIVQYAPYAGTVPVCDDINDRLCAPFKAKLDWHNQRMIELRDSLYTAYTTKAYAEIDDIFTYEFGDMDSRTRTLINLGWLTE